MSPTSRVKLWVEQAVIGLKLCPFAKPYYDDNSIYYFGSKASDIQEAAEEVFLQIERLLATDTKYISNTLIVYENSFKKFDDFLDFIDLCNDIIDSNELKTSIQLAYFHPEFKFNHEETEQEIDVKSDFSARSPYPVIHILRTGLVQSARLSVKQGENVSLENAKTLRKLSIQTLRKVFLERGN